MRKGFISYILLGAIAVMVGLGIYAYQKSQNLGATVYTTQLSDTINTFRNEVNSSTANLNTELETVSGTVINLSSTLNLVPLINGGTGIAVTPSNAQFLSASGSLPTWKTFSWGAGLAVTTTPTTTQINTTGFDSTANYAFTGINTFAGSSTFNGPFYVNSTSTFASSTQFNQTSTFTGNIVINGSESGNVSLGLLGVVTSSVTISATGTFNFATTTIPANTINSTGGIHAQYNFSFSCQDANSSSTLTVTLGTQTAFSSGAMLVPASLAGITLDGQIDTYIYANSGTGSQSTFTRFTAAQISTMSTATTYVFMVNSSSTAANMTQSNNLKFGSVLIDKDNACHMSLYHANIQKLNP